MAIIASNRWSVAGFGRFVPFEVEEPDADLGDSCFVDLSVAYRDDSVLPKLPPHSTLPCVTLDRWNGT